MSEKCHDNKNCVSCKKRDEENDLLMREEENRMRDSYRMRTLQEDRYGETPFDVSKSYKDLVGKGDILYVNVRPGESVEDAFKRYGLEPPPESAVEEHVYNYEDKIPVKEYGLGKEESGGLHYDKGKLRVDLVPPEAIEAIAEVLTWGAKHKYTPRNWEKGINFSRLFGSCMRHLLAASTQRGKDFDKETGLHALKHLLTDVAMLVTYIERGQIELDDRPDIRKSCKTKTACSKKSCNCSSPSHLEGERDEKKEV